MAFLQSALFWQTAAVLAATAASCATLGSHLVLRRMALLTDAIGHVLLLGIVLAFFITKDLKSPFLVVGAALSGVLMVSLVEAVSKSRLVKEDAAIGLVFPALFALGVVLTTMYSRNQHLDIDVVLLGRPEFASQDRLRFGAYDFGPRGLSVMGGMLLLNAGFVALLFKELKLSTFDAGLATSLGFLPAVLHYGLMSLVSLTAVTAFDAVGPVLVVAFFVVPPAAAYLLTDRLAVMVPLGVGIGVVASLVGWTTASLINATTSGTIGVVMGLFFAASLVASPRHGLIAQARRRWRHRRDFYETVLAIHLYQHEGTPAEAEESGRDTLHRHVNWQPRAADAVVRRLLERGWAVDGPVLRLTPEGRAAAVAAVGPRAVS